VEELRLVFDRASKRRLSFLDHVRLAIRAVLDWE
jgi:hypothetical protein